MIKSDSGKKLSSDSVYMKLNSSDTGSQKLSELISSGSGCKKLNSKSGRMKLSGSNAGGE
jgi:hypothetical protein